jgi:hypothetical protein
MTGGNCSSARNTKRTVLSSSRNVAAISLASRQRDSVLSTSLRMSYLVTCLLCAQSPKTTLLVGEVWPPEQKMRRLAGLRFSACMKQFLFKLAPGEGDLPIATNGPPSGLHLVSKYQRIYAILARDIHKLYGQVNSVHFSYGSVSGT